MTKSKSAKPKKQAVKKDLTKMTDAQLTKLVEKAAGKVNTAIGRFVKPVEQPEPESEISDPPEVKKLLSITEAYRDQFYSNRRSDISPLISYWCHILNGYQFSDANNLQNAIQHFFIAMTDVDLRKRLDEAMGANHNILFDALIEMGDCLSFMADDQVGEAEMIISHFSNFGPSKYDLERIPYLIEKYKGLLEAEKTITPYNKP